jgi:hypothetical protein
MDGEFSFLPAPEGLLAWRRFDENHKIDIILNYGKENNSLESLSVSKIIFTEGKWIITIIFNCFILILL